MPTSLFRSLVLVIAAIMSLPAHAQSPEAALSSLPQEQQAWVSRSCPRSLGPSLWSSCVQREVNALKRGIPDLSALEETDRAWLMRSCPSSLGPSLSISCLSRELAALRAGMPKLESLTPEKRNWVLQSCPQSLGPSLFRSCVERESHSLAAGSPRAAPRAAPSPRLSGASRPTARTRSGHRADVYTIETSHNDELFIINGEKFEAQTYCFNMEEEDEVMFLEGSPYGACASATLLNLRTREKCEVWCE